MAAPHSKAEEVALANEKDSIRRNRLLSAPSLFVIGLFGIVPLLIILVYSFLKAAPYGGVEWKFPPMPI